MSLISELFSGAALWVWVCMAVGKLAEMGLTALRQQGMLPGFRVPGSMLVLLEYACWLCAAAAAQLGEKIA